MSVERVREGEVPSAVIASYGFCRTTIYRWLRAAKGRGRGLAALRWRKGTGRPPKLTAAQGRQVFRWINGKDPRQYGFDFGLWTRQVVAELVADRFRVNLSLATVGKLLAALGLTPQKPLMRAYERDPAAIDAWKRDTYPSIAAWAKRLGAEIYFWDESGFRADAVQGRTWGVRGQTPIVAVPRSCRQHISRRKLKYRIVRILKKADCRGAGHQLVQQREPLGPNFIDEPVIARQVASRAIQAHNKPEMYRVSADAEHNWDAGGRSLSRESRRQPGSDYDSHLKSDQISYQLR